MNSEEVGPVSVAEVNRAAAGLRGMGFAQRLMIMVVQQDGAATPAMLAEALPSGTGALQFHLRALISTGLVRRERRGLNTSTRRRTRRPASWCAASSLSRKAVD